ncbi:MAG: cupredoxin domain-containing protein [Hyphomicrobiales bacterium]|nr:cupredoxin domain-containing protein [Hyphomicrobiales bacterium]
MKTTVKIFAGACLALTLGAGAAAAADVKVAIKDYAFAPAAVTIHAGDTVTWTNEDQMVHTVTFKDGGASSGGLAGGATFSRTFKAGGNFAYVCSLHPQMRATVTVLP